MLGTAVKSVLKSFGLEIRRTSPALGAQQARLTAFSRQINSSLGGDINRDTHQLLAGRARVIFDVGANFGQSLRAYRRLFPESRIYAFEPDRAAFDGASRVAAEYDDVTVERLAVAEHVGDSVFYEYDSSVMSSLLKPTTNCWSAPLKETRVPTTTVDAYTSEHGIETIDLLKIDTQGTDDRVLRGAERMLGEGRITLVRSESMFLPLYQEQFDPLALIAWMQTRGYHVVSFYDQHHFRDRLGWCDILYTHAHAPTESIGEG